MSMDMIKLKNDELKNEAFDKGLVNYRIRMALKLDKLEYTFLSSYAKFIS